MTRRLEAAKKACLPFCIICGEPIRGIVCHQGLSKVHFGCGGAELGEALELESLEPCQERALFNVREATRALHDAALPRLRCRVERLGFAPDDANTALTWIRDHAPLVIHIDLEVFGEKVAADTHYRNQFETACSRGCLSTTSRTQWEQDLFGDAYCDASPFQRCKYGVLNVTNDPHGVRACRQYGTSYLLLSKTRFRTTFSAQDSAGLRIDKLATIDYYAHVLEHYTDAELKATVEVGTRRVVASDSRVISTYKEAQIHGEVRLADHVELIMVHPSLRKRGGRTDAMLKQLSRKCNAPFIWIDGGVDMGIPSTPCPAHFGDPDLHDCDDEGGESHHRHFSGVLASEDEELSRAIESSRITAQEARAGRKRPPSALGESDAEHDDLMQAISASLVCAPESREEEALLLELSASQVSGVEDEELIRAIRASQVDIAEAEKARAVEAEELMQVLAASEACSHDCSASDDNICPVCNGSGRLSQDECPLCDGRMVTSDASYALTALECEDDDLKKALEASLEHAADVRMLDAQEQEEVAQAIDISTAIASDAPF